MVATLFGRYRETALKDCTTRQSAVAPFRAVVNSFHSLPLPYFPLYFIYVIVWRHNYRYNDTLLIHWISITTFKNCFNQFSFWCQTVPAHGSCCYQQLIQVFMAVALFNFAPLVTTILTWKIIFLVGGIKKKAKLCAEHYGNTLNTLTNSSRESQWRWLKRKQKMFRAIHWKPDADLLALLGRVSGKSFWLTSNVKLSLSHCLVTGSIFVVVLSISHLQGELRTIKQEVAKNGVGCHTA